MSSQPQVTLYVCNLSCDVNSLSGVNCLGRSKEDLWTDLAVSVKNPRSAHVSCRTGEYSTNRGGGKGYNDTGNGVGNDGCS